MQSHIIIGCCLKCWGAFNTCGVCIFLAAPAPCCRFSYPFLQGFWVFYALPVAARTHQPLSRALGVFSSKALFCGRVLKRPAMSADGWEL